MLLASKYDELDEKIPFINDLLYVYANCLGSNGHKDVLKLESEFVFKFDFDLMILTPLHFTSFFLA